jgi:hypothetical protein
MNKTPLKDKKIIALLVISLALLFNIKLTMPVSAAENVILYLSPSGGTYAAGNTFLVRVKVNSGGQPINAAEGTLIFNPNEVQVVNISKNGSIFSLWTIEPTFSNSAGNIVFSGGTPNPFIGTAGTIIAITFKAKVSASTRIVFSSGSVLAADGKGTNILSSLKGGTYVLKPKIITPPPQEIPSAQEYLPPTPGIPLAPVVSSTTHPDPSKWYSNNSPEFSWKVPSDVTALKLLINHQPRSVPTVAYIPPIVNKKIENLDDGIWYFHIRFKNNHGWGGILHRKVLIDTQPPETPKIKVDNGGDPTNPAPVLYFDTKDSLSGVEYYEVKIGEEKAIPVAVAYLKENPYKCPVQTPGEHNILVKAVDAAGNSVIASANIVIKPLEAPFITDFPKTIQAGEILFIKGTSQYPEATITIFIKKEGEEIISNNVKTDDKGNWLYIHPKNLGQGAYQIWAQLADKRGAKSNPTKKITIAVSLPALIKFGKIAINYLSIMITLAVLIFVLIGIIFYGWLKVSEMRKKLRKETREVAQSVAKAFKALREEVQEQIEYLNKKPGLTKGEKEIRDKLREALDISEEFIGKEIKDIEKELE